MLNGSFHTFDLINPKVDNESNKLLKTYIFSRNKESDVLCYELAYRLYNDINITYTKFKEHVLKAH